MQIGLFIKHFHELFEETPVENIQPETVFRELEEWDSMIALSVMILCDEKYQVRLTPEEMKSAITVNDLFSIISDKINN